MQVSLVLPRSVQVSLVIQRKDRALTGLCQVLSPQVPKPFILPLHGLTVAALYGTSAEGPSAIGRAGHSRIIARLGEAALWIFKRRAAAGERSQLLRLYETSYVIT